MAGRSGEICSWLEVNYRPQLDVSTALDMTKELRFVIIIYCYYFRLRS